MRFANGDTARPARTWHRCTSSVGRLDAAQPRPARRGAGAGQPPQAPGVARPRASSSCCADDTCGGSSTTMASGTGAGPTQFAHGDAQERLYRWVADAAAEHLRADAGPAFAPFGAPFTSRSSEQRVERQWAPYGSLVASPNTTKETSREHLPSDVWPWPACSAFRRRRCVRSDDEPTRPAARRPKRNDQPPARRPRPRRRPPAAETTAPPRPRPNDRFRRVPGELTGSGATFPKAFYDEAIAELAASRPT